jgi:hypothetical protein
VNFDAEPAPRRIHRRRGASELAGLDAHDQPYLNVYGAINRAQTRAVLMPAGAALREQVTQLQEKTP